MRRAQGIVDLDWIIDKTGLSLRVLAEGLFWRDERVVRRWRNGDSPMSPMIEEGLAEVRRELEAGRTFRTAIMRRLATRAPGRPDLEG